MPPGDLHEDNFYASRCPVIFFQHSFASPEHKIGIFVLARAFARQQGMVLSVGSTKTLLHNAAMVNNTDFKELLFYGVRAAV